MSIRFKSIYLKRTLSVQMAGCILSFVFEFNPKTIKMKDKKKKEKVDRGLEETLYLLSNPVNAEWLRESIQQDKSDDVVKYHLPD